MFPVRSKTLVALFALSLLLAVAEARAFHSEPGHFRHVVTRTQPLTVNLYSLCDSPDCATPATGITLEPPAGSVPFVYESDSSAHVNFDDGVWHVRPPPSN